MSPDNVAEQLRVLMRRAHVNREDLARAAGRPRGQYYGPFLEPAKWTGKRYPLDFVAEIAPALVGQGSPEITAEELWLLADLGTRLSVVKAVVEIVPIVGWEMLALDLDRLPDEKITGVVNVAGLGKGKWVAVRALDHSVAAIAPPGSILIVDLDDRELRDGRRYVIQRGETLMARQYHNNPERFESLAIPVEPILIPSPPVRVVGRLVRCITDL